HDLLLEMLGGGVLDRPDGDHRREWRTENTLLPEGRRLESREIVGDHESDVVAIEPYAQRRPIEIWSSCSRSAAHHARRTTRGNRQRGSENENERMGSQHLSSSKQNHGAITRTNRQ